MRDWLKTARADKQLTMKQAADQIGISESYYFLIEQGERKKNLDLALVKKLADVFGMTVQQIAEMEGN